MAVRSGYWKLVFPRGKHSRGLGWLHRYVDEVSEPQLFHLGTDVAETSNLAYQHPEIVRKLSDFAEEARQELGDSDRIGHGARFFDEGPKRPGMDTL